MIFPIGDDQVKGGHYPLFSYGFIALNVVIFFWAWMGGMERFEGIVNYLGARPAETMMGERLWTILSSMFMHGSWGHLIGNMLFMWIFADNIEATIGSRKFVGFYLLGGLVAYLAHMFYNPESFIPTVGASGAIAAVMGGYLIMFPRSRVKMFFFFLIFRIPAWLFLGFWGLEQYSMGRATLTQVDYQAMGVAYWAHIGGFVFGMIAGSRFKSQYLNKPDDYTTYEEVD